MLPFQYTHGVYSIIRLIPIKTGGRISQQPEPQPTANKKGGEQ
jgi:hypothetical protein